MRTAIDLLEIQMNSIKEQIRTLQKKCEHKNKDMFMMIGSFKGYQCLDCKTILYKVEE